MATRNNPKRHFIQLDNRQIKVPAAKWHKWAAAGLLVRVTANVGKPAAPGVIWLQDGEVHEKQDAVYPWINLNCRQIEQHALLDTRGPKLEPWQLQREIQESYGRSD